MALVAHITPFYFQLPCPTSPNTFILPPPIPTSRDTYSLCLSSLPFLDSRQFRLLFSPFADLTSLPCSSLTFPSPCSTFTAPMPGTHIQLHLWTVKDLSRPQTYSSSRLVCFYKWYHLSSPSKYSHGFEEQTVFYTHCQSLSLGSCHFFLER